jgi:aerobic carbon-monoxide dehydrogenase medium subunit
MASFEYHRPQSIDEAVELLAKFGPEGKILAGGQSLVPVMAMRLASPAHVIDITRIAGLDQITQCDDKSDVEALHVGALVRQSAAEACRELHEQVPLVAKALPWIGHRAIRNRGTVCGSLAHADPAAELPASALALGASFVVRSTRGERIIAATDFFRGYLSTALADDELLVGVRFPMCRPRCATAVSELSRRHGDFAVAGVAITLDFDDAGAIDRAAIALFGVSDMPVRVGAAEQTLVGQQPSEALFVEAAAIVSASLDPPSDDHASAQYRRHVAGVLTRRALDSVTTDAGRDTKAAA